MTLTKKLAIAGVLACGATVYLAAMGASNSWQYYLTAEECLAQADKFAGSRLRVSGKVAAGSLSMSDDRKEIRFALAAGSGSVRVVHAGRGPDNLKEGIDVVAEGRLDEQLVLHADKVLTRCASKYNASASSQAPDAS